MQVRSAVFFFVIVFVVALGCNNKGIPYRHLDTSWNLQLAGFIDSATFYTQDTLEFSNDIYQPKSKGTSIGFYKRSHVFSLELKSRGVHGFYEIDKSKRLLILTTCTTPNDDFKSWIKQKSDTFVIDKLSKEELVMHRLR